MKALVTNENQRVELHHPTAMADACGFLWNPQMMLNVNCRGYVTSLFMQPEPAKYSHGPNLEATSFIQPEHPYYAHHPGRFFYLKDCQSGELFSIPFEPVRNQNPKFKVSFGPADIRWQVNYQDIQVDLVLTLGCNDPVELWQCRVTNLGDKPRKLSLYPYFSVGYMSWMNQSASFDHNLQAIICRSISPYQKLAELEKVKQGKDLTFLLFDTPPDHFETCQQSFEGLGGLHQPDGVLAPTLGNGDCHYQTPVACGQYQLNLAAQAQSKVFNLAFGAANNDQEIGELRQKYLATTSQFEQQRLKYQHYISQGRGVINSQSADQTFDHFTNHWLPRQVFYHGDVNRLSTDPQTRNYLQDNLGMVYIEPNKTKQAILTSCAQQNFNGALPDGILLHPDAELKYINQVPHSDHNVWLPLTLAAYLDETADWALLESKVAYRDHQQADTVLEHVNKALDWLIADTDERGLSYINQGDWCDPMNMVGPLGKGVSTWLSLATAYVLKLWAQKTASIQPQQAEQYQRHSDKFNRAINQHCWDGQWFNRGITDGGKPFGISSDSEGRIFLNPQSWAMLSGAASNDQCQQMLNQIDQQLQTPYGVMMLAPAYTKLREDIGRVSQKYPGSAENGSVYNHASMFYIYSLYQRGKANRAFKLLKQMLPNEQDQQQRGQLPLFIPNYYRGAYFQIPAMAGKSSGMFNTGSGAWYYRCIIEHLYGLKGGKQGLKVEPQLPHSWHQAHAQRYFRGAVFSVNYQREPGLKHQQTWLDGKLQPQNLISNIYIGQRYQLTVLLPDSRPTLTVIMGVSGSGKSTLAHALAQQTQAQYLDADDFHSPEAQQQMASGQPLSDQQRLPWIKRICDFLTAQNNLDQDQVLAFSGLRADHRLQFYQLNYQTRFYLLQLDKSQLQSRMEKRQAQGNHFMPASLLDSQLATMEPPQASETLLTVLDGNQTVAQLCQQIIEDREQ